VEDKRKRRNKERGQRVEHEREFQNPFWRRLFFYDTRVSPFSPNGPERAIPLETISFQHPLNSHVCGRGKAQGKRQVKWKARVWIIPANASRDVNCDIIYLHPGLNKVRYESCGFVPLSAGYRRLKRARREERVAACQ